MNLKKLWIPLTVFLIAVFALGVYVRNRMISIADLKLDPVTEAYFESLEKPFACSFRDKASAYEVNETGGFEIGVLKVLEAWDPSHDLKQREEIWRFVRKLPKKTSREQQAFLVRIVSGCPIFYFFQALQSLANVDSTKLSKQEREKIEKILKSYIDPRISGPSPTVIDLALRLAILKVWAENPGSSLRFPAKFAEKVEVLRGASKEATLKLREKSRNEILTEEFVVLDQFNAKFEALVTAGLLGAG